VLTQEPTPTQRERTRLFPALAQPQISKQLQKTVLRIPTPSIPRQLPSFPSVPRFRLPEAVRDVSRGRGLFGKWFLREHPIATPEQVAGAFFGERVRKRKKKRRKKGGGLFGF